MMFRFTLVLLFLAPLTLLSQWSLTNVGQGGRNDDITFINDSIGYAAGGNSNNIRKTTDGGNNWFSVYSGSTYLRTVRFLDVSTGFCGSLDTSVFLMTVDSGNTWMNIADSSNAFLKGICGLSIPTDSVVYGCGVYNQPAYLVKSTDRGKNWTTIDMSTYASSLVEVHFVSADTGFAAGQANPTTDGGVILRTTDGGANWQVIHKTFTNLDYIWKIQSPDDRNYFASVASYPPASVQTTFLKSTNGGLNWIQGLVDSSWYDIQMIGFIDSLKGWTGGGNDLFETVDGGASWSNVSATFLGASSGSGRNYNRFFKLNDSTAFISGSLIYKYGQSSILTPLNVINFNPKDHQIEINPNPTKQLEFTVDLMNSTQAIIQLVNNNGVVVEEFNRGDLAQGKHHFRSSKLHKEGLMFLVMRTNEGFYTEKVIFYH